MADSDSYIFEVIFGINYFGGSPHLSCKRDQTKMRVIIFRTGGLPHLGGFLGSPTSM